MKISQSRVRKLWVPYSGLKFPPPRLAQLLKIVWCNLIGHEWGQWRIETEYWFKTIEKPEPYSWRSCIRCSLLQQVLLNDRFKGLDKLSPGR